jgi:hypothetical protein
LLEAISQLRRASNSDRCGVPELLERASNAVASRDRAPARLKSPSVWSHPSSKDIMRCSMLWGYRQTPSA